MSSALTFPIRLQSIDLLLLTEHGSPRSLTARETSTLRDYADLIVEEIQEAWPVDTGTSRDAWGYELYNHPPGIGFDITNDMEYAAYVCEVGRPGVPIYTSLVPTVVQRHAVALRNQLTLQIKDEEKRRALRAERTATRLAGGVPQIRRVG
jgi:hypothetical protein